MTYTHCCLRKVTETSRSRIDNEKESLTQTRGGREAMFAQINLNDTYNVSEVVFNEVTSWFSLFHLHSFL
jgi:hypothetical protein